MAKLIHKIDNLLTQPMPPRLQKALNIFCYLFIIGFTIYMVDWFVTELAR